MGKNSSKGRQIVRAPATKFGHLQKKTAQTRRPSPPRPKKTKP